MWLYGQMRPTSGLNLAMNVNRREQIDFANSRLGDQLTIEPRVEWNANRHLSIRL